MRVEICVLAGLAACSGPTAQPFDAPASDGAIADGAIADAASDGAVDPDAMGQAPVVASFTLEGSATPAPTLKPTVLAQITAADPDDDVTDVCVRITATDAPAPDDPCWIPLATPMISGAPAPTVVFEVPVPLGYLAGSVAAHAWVRDRSGLVSAPAAPVTIVFDPGTPPVLTTVRATRTVTPCAPLVAADVTRILDADDIYIAWNAVFPEGAPATPIHLDYTTDGVVYTSIAAAVPNAATGGCSLTPAAPEGSCTTGVVDTAAITGCYRWVGNKPAGHLQIRVRAIDTRGLERATDAAPPLDAAPVAFLVGSTDLGLDGSARDLAFNHHLTEPGGVDPGSVAISSRGVVYFRDPDVGLLWIDPTNGSIHRLARLDTLSVVAVDGPIGTATVVAPRTIAIDDRDRLWVWDRYRIRRVDVDADRLPTAMVTVIGGGSDVASSGVAPDQVLVAGCQACAIVPVPGGDVWFQNGYGSRTSDGLPLRVYRAATGLVDAVPVSGTLTIPGTGVVDVAACAVTDLFVSFATLDGPITRLHVACDGLLIELTPAGVAQAPAPSLPGAPSTLRRSGSDGRLYAFRDGSIHRLSGDGLAWERVLGTGAPGNACTDGTTALACAVEPQDLAVDAFARLHWVERGRLRAIAVDASVAGVAGRDLGAGDGAPSLRVRLAAFQQARTWSTGADLHVLVADVVSQRYRDAVVGGSVVDLTGGVTLSGLGSFDADVDGTIYHPLDYAPGLGAFQVVRLDRGTGAWEHFVGGPAGTAVSYAAPSANGADESGVLLSTSTIYGTVVGVTAGDVVMGFTAFDVSGFVDGMIKRYPKSTPRVQAPVAGVAGPIPLTFCADGTPARTCGLPLYYNWPSAAPVHDLAASRWILGESQISSVLHTLPDDPDLGVGTLATVPAQFVSFTYRRIAAEQWIYYCGANDHRLWQYRVGDVAATALPWPYPRLRCEWATLRYLPGRSSLLFDYSQAGRFGVAEYVLPS